MLLSPVSAQATDTFPGTAISGTSGSIAGSNVGATGQTGEPAAAVNGTLASGQLNTIWYSWTAPATGTVTFETCSSTSTNFDTVIASFTGVAVNALALILRNDDTAGCLITTGSALGSRIAFAVTSGVTYRIQVDGYQPATGNYLLTWDLSVPVAAFAVTKTASVSSIAAPGTITYTIRVENTGNATLTGLTISDTLTQGGSARTLTSGPTYSSGDTNSNGQINTNETWVYTATYAVTQSDIDNGGTFSNTVTYDTTQTAPSTSAAATTTVTQSPSFTVVKAQTAGPSPVTAAGQTLTYTITVDNTGNLTLTGLTISDALTLGGSARSLTSGPAYASGDADSDGAIDVTEVWTYTATYLTTQADLDGTGNFSNTATFDSAQTAPSTSAAAVTLVTRSPSFSLLKAQNSGPNPVTAVGQTIGYVIAINNTGNQTLTGLTISDALTLGGSARTLTSGPAYASGDTDSDGAIDVTEVWTYTATYLTTQADLDGTGNFSNTATFDTAQTAPSTSAAVVTNVTRTPLLTITKTATFDPGSGVQTANGTTDNVTALQAITYTYVVTNSGNVTISNVGVSDVHNGSDPDPVPLGETLADAAPLGDSTDVTPNNGVWSVLRPGDAITLTATYQVTQTDVDNLQ